jgi:putative ABC transport system permease protein
VADYKRNNKDATMFNSYFKTTWRNLRMNPIYSLINIGGLTVGLTSCLLLLLYVNYEWSYDHQFSNYENIYIVYSNQHYDNKISSFPVTPSLFAATVQREVPGVVNAVRFLDDDLLLIAYQANTFKKPGIYADSSFFRMFNYKFLKGNPNTALANAHQVVLTEEMSNLLFGQEDPIGKIVKLNNKQALSVSGVIANLPSNETEQFDFVLPWSLYEEQNEWIKSSGWNSNNCYTFVELSNPAVFKSADGQIRKIINTHQHEFIQEAFLHPLSRWHLYSKFEMGKEAGGRISQVKLFFSLAFGILLIACFNFMNLSTARSQNRAKEIGIRKTMGSSKRSLVGQFLTESFLITFIASLLTILLLSFSLPLFNHLLNLRLSLPFSYWPFWVGFLMLTLACGIISGSYPSLYLSSFSPIKVLKGFHKTGWLALSFRKGLVVLQFVLAIFLMISTWIIYSQIGYIRHKPIGYELHNLVEIPLDGELANKTDVLKTELIRSGMAMSACNLSHSMTNVWNNGSGIDWPGKRTDQQILFDFYGAGYDFSRTTGLKIVAGRDFSSAFSSDSTAVLINETAAAIMQLKNPIGSKISFNNQSMTIIAVFKDFVSSSPFQKVNPMLVYMAGGWGRFMAVRLNPDRTTVAAVSGINELLKKLNPGYPPVIHFVDKNFEAKFQNEKLMGALSMLFGLLAIFISCLGLFGLVSFTAAQRNKEIGIRKVFGAGIRQILQLLSIDFLKLIVIAALIVFPISWMVMNQWLTSFDFHEPLKWWIFVASGSLVLFIAMFTVSFQAVKAALADPVKNLRIE